MKHFRFLCICILHILLQYVNLTVSYRNVALFAIFAVLKRIRHDFALLIGLCFHLLPTEKVRRSNYFSRLFFLILGYSILK